MSEAAEKPPPPATAPAGSNKLLLLLVLVVNVLIAGGLAYVVISGQKNNAAPAKADGPVAGHEAEEGASEGEGEGHAKKAASGFGPLVDIGTFVANLTSPTGASRYAKVGLQVEAANDDAKLRIDAAIVPIRNEALLYLSGLNAEQAIGEQKIQALRDELLKRITVLVGKNTVKRVYFSEFVVQ